ncbi:MAG TPA: protein kinase [Terriglobales bacterium]|nr:protein kinase [Terriglobales bacterium]
MALASGSRLGPYEIVAAIGAGGMGEVYRARDTRLQREVAIKVLPGELSANPELRARFEREARAISALNHPHICALYDVGHQDGIDYLVMELLEGESLAERLQRGRMPVQQILLYGQQIAEALEKAHRSGIVHRDLKPGNVVLTKAGAKLLDFGLAKPSQSAVAASTGFSGALTKTTPISPITQQGTVVGTFQYMSPEQIEGGEPDARSDIFSLGAVLYEMATGKRAFEGKSTLSVASAILEKEPPPISTVEPLTPPALEQVVRGCLAKDPEDRIQTAHDVKLQLKWIADGRTSQVAAAPLLRSRRNRERLAWGALTLLLLAALALSWFLRPAPAAAPVKFELAPSAAIFGATISPSGRQVAFIGVQNNSAIVFVRALDSLETRALPGTEHASTLFWSPDEQQLGFMSQGKMRRIDLASGAVQVLGDNAGVGAAWSREGVIVFAPRYGAGLSRMSAAGGDVRPLTELGKGETVHAWPKFLPDGKHFVFLNRSSLTQANHICVGALDSKEFKVLTEGEGVVGYADPGYVIYVRDGALMGIAVSPRSYQATGQPFLVTDKVAFNGDDGFVYASISRTGTLVYQSGTTTRQRELVLVDRGGKVVSTLAPAGPYEELRLSHDGTQVAVTRIDPAVGSNDIWVWSIPRRIFSRVTSSRANEMSPTWSLDDRELFYSSDPKGMYDLYRHAANNTEVSLAETLHDKIASDISPDGRYLIYSDVDQETHSDIWALPLGGGGQATVVVRTRAHEGDGRISPDGRWLAFMAADTRGSEIYVTSFPSGEGRWQISDAGGEKPRWSRDGRQLFYVSAQGKVMAVNITPGARFDAGVPQPLFDAIHGDYSVLKNGQFIFSKPTNEGRTAPITVILNWPSTVKR